MMESVLDGAAFLAKHLSEALVREFSGILPPLVIFFGLHVVLEFILPRLVPGIYDSLGASGKVKPKHFAAEARTMGICIVMSVWVVVGSIIALLQPAPAGVAALWGSAYESTPLTHHLTQVSVAYFLWDAFVCIYDRADIFFHVHAWACLTTFISGLHPFQQMWCPIVLLFEASTPFLHIRKYMIYANKTGGPAFKVVELLFALLFFLCRIVMGLSLHSTMWLRQLLDLIRSNTAHSNAICYLFFVNCLLLSGLNIYWFSVMVRNAACPKPERKPQTAAAGEKAVEGKKQQ